MKNLYTISLVAAKLAQEANTPKITITHEASIVMADSLERAEQMGIEQAHKFWPESDGWLSHAVKANEISRDSLLRAVENLSDVDSNGEAQEFLM